MAEKLVKRNVLFVYGTGYEGRYADGKEFNKETGFPKNKKDFENQKEILEKAGYPKEFINSMKHPVELHYDSIARTIKTAQEKGIIVIIQSKSTPFYRRLRRGKGVFAGIDPKKIRSLDEIRTYSDLRKRGVEIGDVFHAGHWRDVCVSGMIKFTRDYNILVKKDHNKPVYYFTAPGTIARPGGAGSLSAMNKELKTGRSAWDITSWFEKEKAEKTKFLALDLNLFKKFGEKGWQKKVERVNEAHLSWLKKHQRRRRA
ncbi:MAG: hypothetical protein V1911_03675 [Candidatus Micrarchaeota archaeon]